MAASLSFRSLKIGAAVLALSARIEAQTNGKPTICQVLKAPGRYAGKMLTIEVEVVEPRRVHLIDPEDAGCGRIPWMFPANPDVKPKAGFALAEDEKFRAVRDNLGVLLPPAPGSERRARRIFATVEGRFDSAYRERGGASVRVKKHLGYLGADDHVFILKRVLAVRIDPDSGQAVGHEAEHAKPNAAKPNYGVLGTD
jgi:hypothetical protein